MDTLHETEQRHFCYFCGKEIFSPEEIIFSLCKHCQEMNLGK